MKDGKKPEKFLLPHGRPSDDRSFAFSSRVLSKAAKIKALINYGIISLALPTRPDGAQAIETLKAVVVAMGAHLKHEEGSVLEAAWDGTADVQGSLGFQASATGRVRELTLTCLKISGGAEVLCRDVERRYRAQYR